MSKGWRFQESPEEGVFSTRQVLDEGALLAVVSHDPDGDWQFLHFEDDDEESDELRDDDDLVFLPLRAVVSRFPDVVALADLPRGWMAIRSGADAPWVREMQPPSWTAE